MPSASSISGNSNENNTPDTPFEVQKEDILFSSTTSYQVLDFNGEGAFGKVARCLNQTTGIQVAIKIHKENENVSQVIQEEIEMLKEIKCLDPDKNNIVHFIEDFRFKNLSCLAFEMLDRSLWDLMGERGWIPLSLNEIRPITYQLMVAFDALKTIGIIHTDLKPDNIMLVNHQDQPLRIKLIDFGLARRVSEVRVGTMIQPTSFRAPEVTLGLPLTEAVDMWGVGCVIAFLYFAKVLFPSNCSYNLIRSIVHLLGQPADHVLAAGVYSWAYFKQTGDPHNWRLRLPEEFEAKTGIETQLMFTFCDFVQNLEEAVQKYPAKTTDIEYNDRMAFLSLLRSTLDVDPERRISPRDSLNSPFLSMIHLEDKMDTRSYLDEALQCMSILPLNHLDSESESDDSGDSHFGVGDLPQAEYETDTDTDELEVEKHKNRLLKQEMEQLCVSYQRLIASYEDDVQTNHLQSDFDEAIAALQEEREKNKTLRNELDMTTVSLHQAEKHNNKLHEQLQSLCVSHKLFIARYEDEVSKIRKKADALQHDLVNEILQKNHLQSDFDEAIAALQEEREKNNALQSHLEKVAMSLKEADLKYKTEVTHVRKQADTLRSDLEGKLEQNILLQTAHEDLQEVQVSQEMFFSGDETEVIMVTQQANTMSHEPAEESKSDADLALHNLRAEQEEAPPKITDHDDNCKDESNMQHESISNAEPHEPTKVDEVSEGMASDQQETISPAPALEPQQSAEGNLPQRATEPPSFWKRVRHFLGLRKPQRWKRRREGEER